METSNFIPAPQLVTKTDFPKVTIGPKVQLPKNIKLHKNGDVIEKIEIQCSCGEVTLIHCEYE